MTGKAVEAVFFWRYNLSAFRAVYGRFPGTTHSKDFLQSPAAQYPIIDRILKRTGQDVPIEFRWPTGSRQGEWRLSAADARGQLAWQTNAGAPIPWKVGNPSTDPAATIPGDPNATSEQGAEQEWQRLSGQNLGPWILAIKLASENAVLHCRTYLQNPPPGLEGRGISQLPPIVRSAIERLPSNSGSGTVTFEPSAGLRAPALVSRTLAALKRDPNVLLIGPPGTGKTVVLEDLRSLFEHGGGGILFDPDRWDDAWTVNEPLPPAAERKVISLVFHPSYSYEDFVAGLVPQTDNGNLRLVARPGPLLSLAHWAGSTDRHALLLIDEFNRGPTSAIFGDTLALLDGTKRNDPAQGRHGATIQRPYPQEKMEVTGEYARDNGMRDIDPQITLPASVWIVAALNSTDRSVAPIDAALRRRFAILQVSPDYAVLADHLGTMCPGAGVEFMPSVNNPGEWSLEDVKQLSLHLLRALNRRIELVLGQDFLLGHALLWSVRGETAGELAEELCRAIDERVVATLRLTFLDQDEALGGILKIGPPPAPGVRTIAPWAGVARWIIPPADLQAVAPMRLEIRQMSGLPWAEAVRALLTLL
jgi:5-methylcytosine-specific restriction protein B